LRCPRVTTKEPIVPIIRRILYKLNQGPIGCHRPTFSLISSHLIGVRWLMMLIPDHNFTSPKSFSGVPDLGTLPVSRDEII
jgi:hypothetical protein